jgi:diadenosine tetraphosphate (Ap4A) HIT family hydrolase
MEPERRRPFDVASYERRVRRDDCFLCGIVRGDPRYEHNLIYRDDHHIAFLSQYPSQRGYSLVAPIDHREQVVADFTRDEYLATQDVIHRLGRALSSVLPTERLYVLSLGSQQGNSHVHWHVVPLPPGVPYEQQQFAALMLEQAGYLDMSADEKRALAADIGAAMSSTVD